MEVKRELLERALDALDCPGCSIGHRCGKCDNDVDNNGVVRDAIIAALSAPERKPMMDQDTLGLFNRIQLGMRFTDADAVPFAAGVASAEFFHGIK